MNISIDCIWIIFNFYDGEWFKKIFFLLIYINIRENLLLIGYFMNFFCDLFLYFYNVLNLGEVKIFLYVKVFSFD